MKLTDWADWLIVCFIKPSRSFPKIRIFSIGHDDVRLTMFKFKDTGDTKGMFVVYSEVRGLSTTVSIIFRDSRVITAN